MKIGPEARVVFMGTPDFAVPSLSALLAEGFAIEMVVTQPDRPVGRRGLIAAPPVKRFAGEHDLPLMQPNSLRDAGVVQLLRELVPDAIVVAAFGEILRPEILSLPRHGVLNVHASLLPRYRGASPVAAAILAGDSETGVTIMLMDEGLDTGPILAQAGVPVEAWDTTGSLTERLADAGARLLVRALQEWISGKLSPKPQDERQGSHTYRISKEDGRVEWGESAALIERKVRAYSPWPLAHTAWAGKQISLLAAGISNRMPAGDPGQVEGLEPVLVPTSEGAIELPGLIVATGSGALGVTRLQVAGGKAMPADVFWRGHSSIIGATLGLERS